MAFSNEELSNFLIKMAELLEVYDENPYRVRAYNRAARSIRTFSESVEELAKRNEDLTSIPFIGKGIAHQIKIILETGELPNLKKRSGEMFFRNQLKDISGLGPKRIQQLRELNIQTKEELLDAIEKGTLNKIFGKKLQNKLIEGINHPKPHKKQFKLNIANRIIQSLVNKLKHLSNIETIIFAGELRRQKEVITNVELIALSDEPRLLLQHFISLDEVMELIAVYPNSATVILYSGLKLTLKITAISEYAPLLLFATGSKEHVGRLINLALKKDWILNEKGLFHLNKKLPTPDEKTIYSSLGLKYIEPELRENRGEIEASLSDQLPKLITLKDIKGDLHSHTNETDGTETLETMVEAAIKKGYEYLAITDHSQSLKLTRGLDEKRLMKQIELIDELNTQFKNFKILKSSEIDILEDGSLDFPDHILKLLDIRVCSIHSKFKLPEKTQTERIIRAMDNPYFNILGHATGRLIDRRPPYPIDIERILEAAKERGCFIELNAQPARLDINDLYCLRAKQMGVKIAISSDAHGVFGFEYMVLGIAQARRGWLEASDIINTLSWRELKLLLKR